MAYNAVANRVRQNICLDFKDVLIRPMRTQVYSRSNVNVEREFKFIHSTIKWTGVPIMAANMDTIGTFKVHRVMSENKCLTALHKFYTIEDFEDIVVSSICDSSFWKNMIISTGISESDISRIDAILSKYPIDWICVDVANGYMEKLIDVCADLRKKYPDKIIIAGNVATPDIMKDLVVWGGVDIVKIGIGPGSACITRQKAGVGVPQLTAVLECADEAERLGCHIICDGGITCPGDMAKAFVAGADFVMCGGAFSGHDENPGDVVYRDGKQYKKFYGMSSEMAMKTHYGKMEKYRSSEGRELEVLCKGPLQNTIYDYLGGVRSACAYIDCTSLEQMPKRGEFVRVTQQLNTSLV